MGRHLNMNKIALSLVPVLASMYAVPAFAQEQQASVQASIEIPHTVGTGIAFDVLTDTLSSVFLTGQTGDSVSLLLPPRRTANMGRRPIVGGVVVLSATSYSFDIAGGVRPLNPPATQGNNQVNGQDTGNAPKSAGYGSTPGNLLFLAQFN